MVRRDQRLIHVPGIYPRLGNMFPGRDWNIVYGALSLPLLQGFMFVMCSSLWGDCEFLESTNYIISIFAYYKHYKHFILMTSKMSSIPKIFSQLINYEVLPASPSSPLLKQKRWYCLSLFFYLPEHFLFVHSNQI